MLNALVAIVAMSGPMNSNGVPARLLSKFTTGVNVTRWFCYLGKGDQSQHFKTYLTDADFAEFKRLHVKFVRLCVSPDAIYDKGKPIPSVLADIDNALARFNRAGIAVLWDLHDNGQLKLDSPGHDNSGFVQFWIALAKHYKGKSETGVVFELVNEPQFNQNASVWYALQEKTVQAIRSVDPKRTIMVSPIAWSGIDALASMKPLPEKNLIYTFHCYDPFFFTHQGAEWVGEYPKNFRDVPFPSSPEAVAAILDKNDAKYRGTLEDYGRQRVNGEFLLGRLKKGNDWGLKNHVPVVLGEFGAYPKVSPRESRASWFNGMRSAIERLKLPSAIWGYDDGLGLGRSLNKNGTLQLDPVVLRSFYGSSR